MLPETTVRKRAGRLARKLSKGGLEGVIIAPGPNLAYYTGVRAQLLERPFLLVVGSDGDSHLVAPKLESGPFGKVPLELKVHQWDDSEGPSRAFGELLRSIDLKGEWGCEARVPFGFLDHLLRAGMRVRSAESVLQSIREVKEPFELELIKKAARILVDSYSKVPGFLREGVSERELSRSLTEDALANGAETVDPCMVQSGVRAADPHSETSSKKIQRGESVVVDTVITCDGYTADITRTFVIGRNRAFEKKYESVLSAQEAAIGASKRNARVGQVDAAARNPLTRGGLGGYFIHRTGHGLGLEVHEAPYIIPGGRERLVPGMVFTVEPGVYIPGKLGIRIEDDLIVTASGSDVITRRLPKEYGWWR